MDALVDDVAKVVQILNEHSVPSFQYNENVIFERLEVCTFVQRVQMVAESLLIELDVPIVEICGQREAAPQITDNRMQIESSGCAVLGQMIAVEAKPSLPIFDNHTAGLPVRVPVHVRMPCSGNAISIPANTQGCVEELSDKTLLPLLLSSYTCPASPAFNVEEHPNVCLATGSRSETNEDSLYSPSSAKVARLDLSSDISNVFTPNSMYIPVPQTESNAIKFLPPSTLPCTPVADSPYNIPALRYPSISTVVCKQPFNKLVKRGLENPTCAVASSAPQCTARTNATCTVTCEDNQRIDSNTNLAAQHNQLIESAHTITADVLRAIPVPKGNKIPLDDSQASTSMCGTSNQNSAKADSVKPHKNYFDSQPAIAVPPQCIARTNATCTVTSEDSHHIDSDTNMAAENNRFVDSTCMINADVLPVIPALRENKIPLDVGQTSSITPEIRPDPLSSHTFLPHLKNIFPYAAIDFLKAKCLGVAEDDNNALHGIIESILIENNYPRREQSPKIVLTVTEQFNSLREILPNADPTFLYNKCEELIENETALKTFVASALEKRDYPTMASYIARQEEAELNLKLKEMVDNFSTEKFLCVIPDPKKYFSEMKRDKKNIAHYIEYLKHKHRCVRVDTIREALKKKGNNLYNANKHLERFPGVRRMKRNANEIVLTWQFEPSVLQEVCFIENESNIEDYLRSQEIAKEIAFNQAKEKGEFLECGCCFNCELLSEEVNACSEGHIFCIECIKKGAEVLIGDGKSVFPCLTSCEGEFTLDTLKCILQPSVFSKVVMRKQIDEVKAAEIPGLEACPFCEFAIIPNEQDRIFKCLNPECMKESCRLCRKESHIPLRCDEVEENEEVKMRTYIEDKMTDALIRVCWKCSKKFIKEDGCNKMTCTCGAKMCYVCRQPVRDYSHFNGPGGNVANLCPLYTENNVLHVDAIQEVGNHAKSEALAMNPTFQLKNDPTKVLPPRTKTKRLPAGVVDQRDLVLQHHRQFYGQPAVPVAVGRRQPTVPVAVGRPPRGIPLNAAEGLFAAAQQQIMAIQQRRDVLINVALGQPAVPVAVGMPPRGIPLIAAEGLFAAAQQQIMAVQQRRDVLINVALGQPAAGPRPAGCRPIPAIAPPVAAIQPPRPGHRIVPPHFPHHMARVVRIEQQQRARQRNHHRGRQPPGRGRAGRNPPNAVPDPQQRDPNIGHQQW